MREIGINVTKIQKDRYREMLLTMEGGRSKTEKLRQALQEREGALEVKVREGAKGQV